MGRQPTLEANMDIDERLADYRERFDGSLGRRDEQAHWAIALELAALNKRLGVDPVAAVDAVGGVLNVYKASGAGMSYDLRQQLKPED